MWKKLGRIFDVKEHLPWSNSHAQVPTALILEDRLRVYFSTRPRASLSLTSYADYSLDNLTKPVYVHDGPIIELGRPGTFDEHGNMPSSVVQTEEGIFLYYSGWQRAVGVPYNNYTGLAISKDGGSSFEKYSESPILDRNSKELFSATSPGVVKTEGEWYMWYCSGVNWLEIGNKMEHTYDIKFASSSDGKNWKQDSKVAIAQESVFDAITRPSVYWNEQGRKWELWFCKRGSKDFRDGSDAYKILKAESTLNGDFKIIDIDIFTHSNTITFDNAMQAYPEVFEIAGERYMLYNGNSFGAEGICLAKWKE